MKTPMTTVTLAFLLFGVNALGHATEREEATIKKIERLGGEVKFNEDGLVRDVLFFYAPKLTKDDLKLLKSLIRLEDLHLTGCDIDDADLKQLTAIKTLRYVELNDTHITDAGLAHLKNLPNLTAVNLSSTKITDAGLAHLKGLTKISWLSLDRTKVTDKGLAHLRNLWNLEYLGLGDGLFGDMDSKFESAIGDAGLLHLKELTKLRNLDLSGTQVTDEGLAHLVTLQPSEVAAKNGGRVS